MRKMPLLLVFFLAVVIETTGQSKTVAQLKKELDDHPQQDALRVDKLNDLSLSVLLSVDQRRKLSEEAVSIAQKINYSPGEAYALANIAYYKAFDGNARESDSLMRRAESLAQKSSDPNLIGVIFLRNGGKNIYLGNKEAGMNYLVKAEEVFEKSTNYKRLAQCQVSIANYYQINFSNYPAAMEYLVKASESAEKANSPEMFYKVWSGLSNLYFYLGDFENSLAYLKRAREQAEKAGADIGKTNLLNDLGEIYRLTEKYPEAIEAYQQAIKGDASLSNVEIIESNLADVYTRMNNLPLAFQYGFSSLVKARQTEDLYNLAWIHGILARAYLKIGMPDSSIYLAGQGLDFANERASIEFMRDNAEALANAYAYKKDFANAYKYHLQYIDYRDSMVNTEVRNRAAVLQYSSDLEKKQAQIVQLSQQKKIQKGFLYSAVIVLALILVTAGLLLRNNRQKQKANKLLRRQKQEIDAKAKDLEQSYNNVELLGDIGRKVTSSLSVETIISTVYDSVNSLMDASVFGIGIYHEDNKQIDFPATYEDGTALPAYSNSIYENRLASLCFISGNEVVMGDTATEYKNYMQQIPAPKQGKQAVSLIYLPLKAKDKIFGVITVQSFQKNAYSEYHLYMLRTIALYAAIALENAESYRTLNQTVDSLRRTQSQLIQSEKMASLGELTAGIAHEIQNPLNFVNNFAEVNVELIEELGDLMGTGDLQSVNETFEDIRRNLEKIKLHGRRADSIVKGMLQHSQSSTGMKEAIDINALTDEYLRLAYHGLRAKDKSFNAITKTEFDHRIEKISVVPQEIGRVLLNLINNAYYTVNEKKKIEQNGYEPTVTVSTVKDNGTVKIKVKDNGNGIPQKILDKIFQPFFTTKPTGQGTGLGLSLAYDIVKAHGGEIKVETMENEGTEFTMVLAA